MDTPTGSALPHLIWVTIEKAAELLGLTRQAIYARIKRREWREGVEYSKRGHRVFINMPAVYAWITQG
tara:strand:- start:2047 stop:2250 length:204 start_codon:yes stop_codon:yes gene_type:complete